MTDTEAGFALMDEKNLVRAIRDLYAWGVSHHYELCCALRAAGLDLVRKHRLVHVWRHAFHNEPAMLMALWPLKRIADYIRENKDDHDKICPALGILGDDKCMELGLKDILDKHLENCE